MPGDDVAVVLQVGDEYFITGLDVLISPGIGDQINARRGSGCEDDFIRLVSAQIQPPFDGLIRKLRSPLTQCVHRSVNVAVVFAVVPIHGRHDRLRFVCRRCVVEVGETFFADPLVENWELRSSQRNVEAHVDPPSIDFNRSSIASRSRSASIGSLTCSAISRANAPARRRRLTTSSKPRLRKKNNASGSKFPTVAPWDAVTSSV